MATTLAARSPLAPLGNEIFSGGSHLTDGVLADFLGGTEERVASMVSDGHAVMSAYRGVSGLAVAVTAADKILYVTTTSAAAELDLPAVATIPAGFFLIVQDSGSAGTNNITLDPDGTEQIDGGASKVLATNSIAMLVYSTGTAWRTITLT